MALKLRDRFRRIVDAAARAGATLASRDHPAQGGLTGRDNSADDSHE